MTTERLGPEDIRTGVAYEAARAAERHAVAEAQRDRRVALAGALSLVFESRDSIRESLEEMIRAEHITDPQEIAQDAAAFNDLVPREGRLGATLYVDAGDAAELGTALASLEGVQSQLYIEIGGERVHGTPAEGAAAEELAAASFVVFALTARQREAWLRGEPVAVAVAHPQCTARSVLTDRQRAAIGADLM